MSLEIIILLSSLILLLAFYLYARHKQTYWSRRGVYSPPAHWFFGHLRDAILLRASPAHVLGDVHRAHAHQPVVGVYILHKPFLLVRDREIVKRVLVKDFPLFPDRYFASKRKADVVGSANLFAVDNPQWAYLRKRLSPGFTANKQKKLFELMLESAENMRRYLSERTTKSAGEDVAMEITKVSGRYTTDVISSLAFGVRTNSFSDVEPEFYRRTRTIYEQSISRTLQLFLSFFFPKVSDYIGDTFLGSAEDYFRQVFWDSMNERERSGAKRGDIIDLLVDLKREPTRQESAEFDFRGDHLLAQSAIFFVAGLESSSVTMSFTLLELAKHPDVQSRARRELREKLGDARQLAYEMISEMSYLQQVVSETLRLYPPAPLLDRVAVQDYKIPGTRVTIEKGTGVYVALTGLHMDPQHHVDPTKYDPDRFSEERKAEIQACTYMPFGDGPRVCIGQRIGVLQTMTGLITILREYEVALDPRYENEVSKRAIFTAPADGVHLYLRRAPIAR